jgi:ATP-dependent helicase/nuclease subunit B
LFRLHSADGAHLENDGTLIVPSRQRAHAVRLAHAAGELAAGRRVWTSADVLPAAGWLRREVERAARAAGGEWPRLLGPGEEWLLWRLSTREAARDLPLLDAGELAVSLERASELAADYGIAPAAYPGSESAVLREVQRSFRERCRALDAAGSAALVAHLSPAPQEPAALLRGFDSVPPRLRALARTASAPAGECRPGVVRAADAQQELDRIAEWCRERLRLEPQARLLVMLPGAPGMRERLAALIRQALDPGSLLRSGGAAALVGIEGGQPLALQPLIAHALSTLELLAGAQSEFEELTAWLLAPYWERPTAEARARLVLALRERATLNLTLRELLAALRLVPPALAGAARELAARLAEAASALGGPKAGPRQWSERWRAALAAARWPGAASEDSAGLQTVVRWHELLDEFGTLDASAGPLGREEALGLLRERAAHTAFRPADEDVTVMISPLLADPVVRYDGIWVAGLHADALPQPVAPDPFLPVAAQRAAGVPQASSAGRWRQAHTLLGAWRAGTPCLVLSAPARAGDLELLPSPLLTELSAGAEASAAPAPLSDAPAIQPHWLPQRLRREGGTETVSDLAGLPWSPAQRLPRGTRTIELQNQCPFRAYAELRLGSLRPESPEPGVPPQDRGRLLHLALQTLWDRLGDSQALKALSAQAQRELIEECVTRAAQETLAPRPPGRRRRAAPAGQLDMFARPTTPAVARECRRAVRLIGMLCELERTRQPFRVESLEQLRELRLAGATLQIRMDRVDVLEAGGHVLLDYKTGQTPSADWYGERPTYPQLLTYLTALGEQVAALATVNLNARAARFSGVARAAGLLPDVRAVKAPDGVSADAWLGQQRSWRALIERLIGDFLQGWAAVDPRPGACAFCHVVNICRIAEREAQVDPHE